MFDPVVLVLLAAGGLLGGFLGGLTGLGGGVVFAPVLLAALRWMGVPEADLVPLVTGTSLFATLLSVASSARAQALRGAVEWRIAIATGLVATASLWATKALVTGQPGYTPRVFEVVFAAILVVTALRMFLAGDEAPEGPPRADGPRLALVGLAAGALSAAGGVGGGGVLVPAFNRWLRLPLRTASGTSNATIVLSSMAGGVAFLLTPAPGVRVPGTVGSVSFVLGLALALPAVFGARGGVALAHRLPLPVLRRVFATVLVALASVLAFG